MLDALVSLFSVLLPVVSTAAVAQVKRIAPAIPKVLMPLASVAVGTVGAVAGDYLIGTGIGPANGALLGLVGIGVREIADQAKKAIESL